MHTGARIGRYEVVSMIGRGGMGEVWRARDTKLLRDVAIKTLPPELAQSADRRARLEREATLLAALNHPNIATIHGIEEHDDSCLLVLELAEGMTLADRLRDGGLPVVEALEAALQIATALEAAHDKSVIHRDLKPANISITPDGRVKVLDFGLAKTITPASNEVTSTAAWTEAGVVMGTTPYLSPEQARGEEAGRQTDIWSFGVVLYEMLTGVSPFARDTAPETLARVLESQPDFAMLPPATPASARHVLRRCLEKDRRRRFRDIGDVRIEVEEALAALAAEHTPSAAHPPPRITLRAAVAVLTLTALTILAGIGVWSITERTTSPVAPEVVRFSIAASGTPLFSGVGVERVALSVDGSRFAHALGDRILIRQLRAQAPIAIDVAGVDPFFSPDGEWLGFLAGGVKKVPSAGGAVVNVAEFTDRPAGATWRAGGTIVFATTAGLYEVAADGGVPRLLAKPDPARRELQYAWPRFLPDGRSVLFTIVKDGPIDGAEIAWLDPRTLATAVVLTGGTSARYVPTGHLVYAARQTLMAVPFDLDTRTTRGDPIALRDIAIAAATDNGAANFAVSDSATLAFIARRPASPLGLRTLLWADRQGNEEPLALEPGRYVYARISPDGTRVAIDVSDANRDIWIWDLGRETLTRLTDGPNEDMTPLWSPDSRRVFFASNRTGNFDVYSQPADGSTQATVELVKETFQAPSAITPDGTQLVVTEEFRDLHVLDLTDHTARPLLEREANDWIGELSPDGRWLAYESDESGAQFEIYVRPFPDVMAQREKVSLAGGRYPRWSPGSNELYYVALDGSMMAAEVELEPTLRVRRATKLFDYDAPPRGISGRPYDVSPVDGRFLIMKFVGEGTTETVDVSVVLNWFEELREQAR